MTKTAKTDPGARPAPQPAAEPATEPAAPALPQSGGAWERAADGSLVRHRNEKE